MAALECLFVLQNSADHISFPLGALGPLWYLRKCISAKMYTQESVLQTSFLLMKSLNKAETPFFISHYARTKTRLYTFHLLKPHLYIVKLGFTGVCIIFLILLKT